MRQDHERPSRSLLTIRVLTPYHVSMKATSLIATLLLATLLFTGCGNPRSIQAITQGGAHIATSIALQRQPEIRPYLTAIVPVICAAAAGTNSTPDSLVAKIETMPSKNVAAAAFVNTLLAMTYVYLDGPDYRAALQGVCTGATFGLLYGEPKNKLGTPRVYPSLNVKGK